MKKNLITIIITMLFSGCSSTHLVAEDSNYKKIHILDKRTLHYEKKGGIPFSEISDITYNHKQNRLYMIGDKGYFYTFSVNFNQKIDHLKYLNAFYLKDKLNRRLKLDIEGLTHNAKNKLIASFEGKPKISKIATNGTIQSNYKLPKKLRKKSYYRSKNKMFEAVAFHPKYGILTVSEYPLKKRKKHKQTIYALNGKEWHFKTESYKNSAITAIEVMDDNNILVLERAYSGLSNPLMITLKKVYIDNCDSKNRCPTETLLSFDSFESWDMGNFEGLAKVGKNRYIMVSDNNNKSFLPTVLIYFEVIE